MARKYPRIQPKTAPAVAQLAPIAELLLPPLVLQEPAEFKLPESILPPVIRLPKAELAPWTIARLFDGTPRLSGFSRFDCFTAATLARAAYSDNEELHDSIQSFLVSQPWQKRQGTVSGVTITWYEYETQFGVMLSYRGTTDIGQWARYLQPLMRSDPTYANLYVYQGLRPFLDASTSLFATTYPSFRTTDRRSFSAVGHSMGGALAHWNSFDARIADPNDPTNYGKWKSVFTFGAPAFMLNPNGNQKLASSSKYVRTVNPGDPVPDLVQQAIKRLGGLGALVAGIIGDPPRHYDTYSWLLDGRNPRKFTAWDVLDAARQNLVTYSVDQFRPHKISSYCDALERECLKNGDTPYPQFTSVVSINRQLTALGK